MTTCSKTIDIYNDEVGYADNTIYTNINNILNYKITLIEDNTQTITFTTKSGKNMVIVGVDSIIPVTSGFSGDYVVVNSSYVSIETVNTPNQFSTYYKCAQRNIKITKNVFNLLNTCIVAYINFNFNVTSNTSTSDTIFLNNVYNSMLYKTNLYLTRISTQTLSCYSLFIGSTVNSCIKECIVDCKSMKISISVNTYGGLFVSEVKDNTQITLCTLSLALSTITVTSNNYSGGFAGAMTDSELNSCSLSLTSSTITVTSNSNSCGVFVGSNINNCIIMSCSFMSSYSTINIFGIYIGGFAGYTNNSQIKECSFNLNNSSKLNLSRTFYTGDSGGGFVGESRQSIITLCSFVVNNTSNLTILNINNSGGFVGYLTSDSIMNSCSFNSNNKSIINISSKSVSGGYVGTAYYTVMTSCSFKSNDTSITIYGVYSSGGFAGECNNCEMTSCLFDLCNTSTLNISGDYNQNEDTGGFIAYISNYTQIQLCNFISDNTSNLTIYGYRCYGFCGIDNSISNTIKECALIIKSSKVNLSGHTIYGFGILADSCICNYKCNNSLSFTATNTIYGYASKSSNTSTFKINGGTPTFTAPTVYILTGNIVSAMTVKLESLTINSTDNIYLNNGQITNSNIFIYGIFSNPITSYQPGISSVLYKTPLLYYENSDPILENYYVSKIINYKKQDTMCCKKIIQLSNLYTINTDITQISISNITLITADTAITSTFMSYTDMVLVGVESTDEVQPGFSGDYVIINSSNQLSIENDFIHNPSSKYYKCASRKINISDNVFGDLTHCIVAYIDFQIAGTNIITDHSLIANNVNNSYLYKINLNSDNNTIECKNSLFIGTVDNSCIINCDIVCIASTITISGVLCGGFAGYVNNKTQLTLCSFMSTNTTINILCFQGNYNLACCAAFVGYVNKESQINLCSYISDNTSITMSFIYNIVSNAYYSGGFVGYVYKSLITFSLFTIDNTLLNISSKNSGGFVGFTYSDTYTIPSQITTCTFMSNNSSINILGLYVGGVCW